MSTAIQRETWWDCIRDIEPLLADHWREVALYQDQVPLEPDYSRYVAAENQGRLVMVTARKDGVLVGYSVFILHHHIHYKNCLVASNDVVYLRPDCRGFVGARLLLQSENILREAGVDRVTWHVKPKHDWSSVLERMGYDHEEIIMGKLLRG